MIARTPIAFHDLGDAWRLSGKLDEADEAYEQAIRSGAKLDLNHTVELARVKRIMCRLLRGETEGVVDELRELAPRAVKVGLGLAQPFCALLEAWALSLLDDTRGTLAALERVGELPAVAVDPEVASILRRIAALLCENQDSRARGEALAEFADLLGEPKADQRPDIPPTE